jgi:ATP adenylyltransferase
MQQLHAYWRMEYIEAPRYPPEMKRPFTELPALRDDRAALIGDLAEGDDQLDATERADLFDEIVLGKQLLAAALRPDAYNVGFNLGASVAGGSIAHLHAHIVPRWNGDSNFMPVIGQTRILPQALAATWEKLAAAAVAAGHPPPLAPTLA